MAFQKGHKLAPGGAREGAGRPLDWLKEQTRDIIRKDKLVERLGLIASGKDIPQPLSNGEVVPIPAPVAEQRKAILDLLERGYGKVETTIELNDVTQRPNREELEAALAVIRRGHSA